MGRILLFLAGSILAVTLQVRSQPNLWTSYEVFGEKEGFQTYHGPGRITSDKDGLLWIAGDNGLFSFDGSYVTNYRYMAGNDSSLPFNEVVMNYQDKQGNYWVSIFNKGLYTFDPLHRSFRFFKYPGMDSFNIHHYRIADLLDDGEKLWIVLPDFGLASWDKKSSTMRPYKICPPGNCGDYYSTSWVTTIMKDPNDNCFWIGSNNGLIQLWPATGDYEVFKFAKPSPMSTTVINFLHFDEDGLLWCGTWGFGLLSFDRRNKTFKNYHWKPLTGGTQNICSGIYHGNANQLWVGSRDNGLMLFDKRSETFRKVRSPERPDESIEIFYCYKGQNNTMWVADQKKLYRYDLDTSRFVWHPIHATDPEHQSGGVFSFLAFDNKLFCGIYYDGHFGWYNRSTNTFLVRHLTSAKDNEAVRHLSVDRDGIVWIGTVSGAFMYQPQTDRLIVPRKFGNSNTYFNSWCNDVWHNDDGSHWMATDKGLVLYDPIGSRMVVFDTMQPARHRLRFQFVNDIFKDSKGRIWIGGLGNDIACYIPEKDSIVYANLGFAPSRENSYGFCEDKNGNILFALVALGLVVIEHPFTDKHTISLCNTGNSLPTDRIHSILRDSKDRIWLYTANGLMLFDPVSKKYRSFKTKNGLFDNYLDSYPYQDSTGLIYVGFGQGFQTFHPDSLLAKQAEKVNIRINDLLLDGTQWSLHPAYSGNITLPPNPGNMSFSFAALGRSLSESYGYAYMLEGYDKNWHYSNSTSGQYNNLPPGNYILRIKAAIHNDEWVSQPFGLPLVVLPAWYQSMWFKILLGLLALGLVYGIFSYRIRQVKREAALKESFQKKINELEMRSLRAQMNPHFIFNSLSSINRYIVKSDHRTASNYLTKFSKLIRMILDNSAMDVISVEKELQTLQLYIDMEELRFDHAFAYNIRVDGSIDQEETYIPSMLLQPYVENAIWHGLMHREGGGGMLSIKLSLLSPTLLMAVIEDNGIGREKAIALKSKESLKKKSYGMQISHDRLELLNRQKQESSGVVIEDVVDEEGSVNGTRVILHIPIQNKLS